MRIRIHNMKYCEFLRVHFFEYLTVERGHRIQWKEKNTFQRLTYLVLQASDYEHR
jgi:hypothetical protein